MSDDPMQEMSEKVGGYLTVALTAAGRMVEVAAHRRAQEMREAQLLDQRVVRALEQQSHAEAAVVRHDLRDVARKEWWDTATVEQIAGGYAAAQAYGQLEPDLAGTARYMGEEIRRRYGAEADQLVAAAEETARAYLGRGIEPPRMHLAPDAGKGAVAARSERYVDDVVDRGLDELLRAGEGPTASGRQEGEHVGDALSHGRQQLDLDVEAGQQSEDARTGRRRDQAEAATLITEADVTDALGRAESAAANVVEGQLPFAWHDPELQQAREARCGYNDPATRQARLVSKVDSWDEPGRRESLATRLDAGSMPVDAQQARIIADGMQGKPAALAPAAARNAARAPKARNTPVRGTERVVGR